MPRRPPSPCRHLGCPALADWPASYCNDHRQHERSRRQPNRSAAARGYDRQWRKERAAFLARHPRCVGCGGAATVVDHIVPHRGDRQLFYDHGNWQALCASCHGRKTVAGA